MCPTLIHIGPVPLPSYGFMLAASFAAGIVLACHRARARGVAPGLVLDTAVVIVPAAIVGARVPYVLLRRGGTPERKSARQVASPAAPKSPRWFHT